MKNVEKYSNELISIYSSGYKVAINKHTHKPVKCCIGCITCAECLLNVDTCDISKFVKWLGETYISTDKNKKGE